MKWKKHANLVLAVVFTFAYVIMTLFLLLGTSHPPSIANPLGVSTILTPYPLFGLLYLILALIISWGIYYFLQDKEGALPFFISLFISMAIFIVGIFVWMAWM